MPTAVAVWVWFCAYLNCAGWALSAIHQLNPAGYAVVLVIGMAALLAWRKRTSPRIWPRVRWQKIRRRFRRPFPLAFLILALLAFLGGALYRPTNYDTLAYRIPRVLHWLNAGQWHWIHTVFGRLNIHSVGIEWLYAPALALLNTDRFLFLINFISFLFLPGLVFSIFTRLGVRPRVAWHWMWLVPTGYGFLLQAGGIGNDLYGATLVLAGMDFALRSKTEKSPRDLFTSLLAMAAATSAKSSNLPLLLPWGIMLLPSIKLLAKRPWQAAAVCGLAALASAAPLMVLNSKYAGNWAGDMVKNNGVKNETLLRVGANAVLLTIQNFVPPVFPQAEKWNREVKALVPPALAAQLAKTIEWPGCEFKLEQMQTEENAGLGFGLCVFLLLSVVGAGFGRRGKRASPKPAWWWWVSAGIVACWVAVMIASRWTAISRYLIPYYVVLLPLLLAGSGHASLVRRRGWRLAAYLVFALAALPLILSPSRPLYPVNMFLGSLPKAVQRQPLFARTVAVYSVYSERNDAFSPARAALPPNLKILGYFAYDAPETSLWRPFGSRRIEHVCPGDTAADLKRRGIEYVLLRTEGFATWFGCSPDDWVKHVNGQVVQKIPIAVRVLYGVEDWYLVRLN